jgi:two-component system, NarL family, nitrate/nitrite response regulator NarL
MEAPSHVVLTPRERDLVRGVVAGRTDREMAREFGVPERAIKDAMSLLYEKCQVGNRLELVLFAVCHDLWSR